MKDILAMHLWRAIGVVIFLLAMPIFAQQLADTPRGVVVVHDRVVELPGRWKADGVANATAIVASADRVAVLDAMANEARIVELATGRAQTVRTGETPIGGLFLGRDLYLLERDARALERIGGDGARASVQLAADPAFLREANGLLYVYSRAAGVMQEIDPSPLHVRRTLRIEPFASDFEVDARSGYLVYPRAGKLRTFSLRTMTPAGEIAAGAVPVDLASGSGGTALTARTLAVADPAGKRVWLLEGSQSASQAFARGFLRGLLGLGLFGGNDSQFPTGVDRVMIRGPLWIAYDSSSGTLYRFTKSKSSVIARDVEPGSFVLTAEGVVFWRNGMLVAQKGLK